jgi:hypothetical protein
VSFYPVNAMGLKAFDRPIDDDGPTEGEVQALGVRAHRGEDPFFPGGNPLVVNDAMIAQRTDNLQSLAENTDGLAVVRTNDIDAGIQRIVDDLSSYYLLGYYSTGRLDGRYRTITVRVKRPRVDVRRAARVSRRDRRERGDRSDRCRDPRRGGAVFCDAGGAERARHRASGHSLPNVNWLCGRDERRGRRAPLGAGGARLAGGPAGGVARRRDRGRDAHGG